MAYCTKCKHPGCGRCAGSSLCAFCEDDKPCPSSPNFKAARAVAQVSDPENFIRPIPAEDFSKVYRGHGFTDVRVEQIISQLDKLPSHYTGEISLPKGIRAPRLRGSIGIFFRRHRTHRVRIFVNPLNPHVVGVKKEPRSSK